MNLNIWDLEGETLAQIMEHMTFKYVDMFLCAFNKLMTRKLVGAGGLRTLVLKDEDDGILPKFSSPLIRNLTSFTSVHYKLQGPRILDLPKTLKHLSWYSVDHLLSFYPMKTIADSLPALETLSIISASTPLLPLDFAFSNAPQGLTSLTVMFWGCTTEAIANLPTSLTKLSIPCRAIAIPLELEVPLPNIVDLSFPEHVIVPGKQYILPPTVTRLELRNIADSEWENLPATLIEVQINGQTPKPGQCRYPKNIKILRFVGGTIYERTVHEFPGHLEQLVVYDIVYDFSSVPEGTEILDDWPTLDKFWKASKPSFKITLVCDSPMRKLDTLKLPPASVTSFEIPNHGYGRSPILWPSMKAVRCGSTSRGVVHQYLAEPPLSNLPRNITRLSFDKTESNQIFASAIGNLQHLSDAVIMLDSSCVPTDQDTLTLPADAEMCFWKNVAPAGMHIDNVTTSCVQLLKRHRESPSGLKELSLQGSYFIQDTFLHFLPPLQKLDLENAVLMPSGHAPYVMTLPRTLTELALGGSYAMWVLRPSDPVVVEWVPSNLKILTINAKSGSNDTDWNLPRLPNLVKLTIKAFKITERQLGSLPPHLDQIVHDKKNHQVVAEGVPSQSDCTVM